jgi:hypothetical protein
MVVTHDKSTGSGRLDSNDETERCCSPSRLRHSRAKWRKSPTLPQPLRGHRLHWRIAVHAEAKQPARRSTSRRGKTVPPRLTLRCGVGWGDSDAGQASVGQRAHVTP